MRSRAKSADTIEDQIARVADAAHSMIDATADAAEEKVVEARQKLRSALDTTKGAVALAQKRVSEGADMTDQLIREKPYHAIGIAFGVGAVIGFLLSSRNSR
jgi:ElaB/YqjD/DUF883 family membrane-anchored ribosome-binding protein